MKHFKLFLLALVALVSSSAWAENYVDVTSTYLDNADFSLSTPIDNNVFGYQKDAGSAYYWAQDVTNWTVASTKADAAAGAVFAYGSSYQLKGNSKAAPSKNPDGEASGNALGLFAVWGGDIQYTQTVKAALVAGTYKLTYTYYNQSGTNAVTNKCGVIVGSTNYFGSTTSFSTGSWKSESVTFIVTEETSDVKVSLGYTSKGSGSGANPMLFFDNVKLEFDNTVDKTALEALITDAEAIYDSGKEGAADFKSAIDAATAVKDNGSATLAEVVAAEEALTGAIDLYKRQNATSEEPYDLTSKISNAGFESGTSTSSGGKINFPVDWTVNYSMSGWLDGSIGSNNPSEGEKYYNLWAGSVTYTDMYQTVTLAKGIYELAADLRTDGTDKITDQGVYAKIGGSTYKSGTITSVASTWNSAEGWNNLKVQFTVTEESSVQVGASSTGTGSGTAGWYQIDNFTLKCIGFPNEMEAAKAEFLAVLNAAPAVPTANVGSAAFQYPTAAVNTYSAAKDAAQDAYDNATTVADVTAAKTTFEEAVNAFNAVALNTPAEGAKYKAVTTFTGDAAWNNTPITGYVNASAQGGYSQQYGEDGIGTDVYRTNVLTFTPVTDKKDTYLVSYKTSDGTDNYLCTGAGGCYGGNVYQIRCTTDAEKALEIEVQATDEEGIWKLYNTEANQYIGDNNDKGVYTTANHNDFQLVEAAKTVTLGTKGINTFSSVYDVVIPEGVEAYYASGVSEKGLHMKPILTGKIPANTGVVLKGTANAAYQFVGTTGAEAVEDNLLVAVSTDITDLAPTTDEGKTTNYVLVSGLFCPFTGKATVNAGKAYLSVATSDNSMPVGGLEGKLILDFGDETGVAEVAGSKEQVAGNFFDLMGRKVSAPVRGNVYIVNGKKYIY